MRPPRNFYTQAFKRDAGMLSRVADSLYWMGRYLERAEHTSRLVNVELQLWLDQSPELGAGRWRFLLEAFALPLWKVPLIRRNFSMPWFQPRQRFVHSFLHHHGARKPPPRS